VCNAERVAILAPLHQGRRASVAMLDCVPVRVDV
jgi:hypothetical protein